jgi:hypothetical protein
MSGLLKVRSPLQRELSGGLCHVASLFDAPEGLFELITQAHVKLAGVLNRLQSRMHIRRRYFGHLIAPRRRLGFVTHDGEHELQWAHAGGNDLSAERFWYLVPGALRAPWVSQRGYSGDRRVGCFPTVLDVEALTML